MPNKESMGGHDYFDRFDPRAAGEGVPDAKRWDKLLFAPGKIVQAAELNEIQSVGAYYVKNLGLAIFNEGDIVSGLSIWQQKSDGTNFMHVLAGKVFIDGKVRHISQQNNIKLDATGTEYLGLKLDVKYLTENDDSSYRDPAEGFDNYNQAGAHRRRFDYTWKVWRPGTDTTYVQVFELYNGYQRNLTQGSPAFSKIYDALARRTFDESGDYMLRPFQVSVKNNPNDSSTMYVITGKGKAYVRGHEIDMGTSQQTLFEKARDLRGVTGDAITYRKDTAVYELTDDYVASISSVTANVLVVEAVTRGAAAGGTDALTNTPVQDILQVCASYGELDATRQLLETTVTPYTESTDWNQTGNTVDWSPAGAEPAGASTYYVLYTYQTTLTPAVRTKTRINALAVTRSGSLTYDRLSDPTGAGLKTVSGQDGISVAMITDTAAGVSATWIQGYDYYVATGRNNDELVRNNIYDADRYSSASGSDGAQDWEKEIGSIVIDWGTGSSSQPAAGASYYCFTGDTKIPLLNGQEYTLKELSEQFTDKEFWVYSVNKEGQIVPGMAHHPRLTRKNARIIEIELDNGEKIRCTENHPFMMRNGRYKKAIELEESDSLMPLYRTKEKYERIYNPKSGKFEWTHKLVAESLRFEKGVIHHKDFNSRNNSPNNLQDTSLEEHGGLHKKLGRRNALKRWNDPIEASKWRKIISRAVRKSHKGKSLEEWAKKPKVTRKKMREAGLKRSSRPEVSLSMKTSNKVKNHLDWLHNGYFKMYPEKHVNNKWKNPIERLEWSKKNSDFMKKRWENEEWKQKIRLSTIKSNKRRAQARRLGFNNVQELKVHQEIQSLNHKIKSIRFLGYEDVYDFSVEQFHNFAISAGIFVHNCTYDYWAHSTPGDYVHAGSYDSYSDIDRIAGIYSGANFTDQYMRDTIDFRSIEGKYPYGYTNKGSGGTKKQIRVNTSVTINYTHYLRRIDCLYMDPRGYVKIKKGDPGINPGMVNVPGDSMGIAFLDILPYTYDTNDVNVRTIQNKRYTMKDIAKIEDRVKRLEYFNVSQMLESDAFSKFTVGEKRGVFVDTFIGTAHSDINFGDGTIIYDVCVDPTSETLRLGYNMGQTDLTISAFGGDTAQWNNALTLPVTEKLLFENPYATGWDSVQPFEVFDKHGELELYPEQDYWIDTGTPPQMDVDITGDLQHRTETLDNSLEWGAWRTVATGWNINWRRTQPWPSNVLNQERWGQREGHVPGQNFIDLGDRVVDVSWIPFCREKTIEVQAMAMRVSTGQLRVTFGGDVMTVSAASATYVADSLHAGDPSWYIDTNNTVKTDANGFTAFQFTIPGGTYPVGAHEVRVDNPTAGKQSRTYAGHEFEARGMYQQKEHVHVPRKRTPKKPEPKDPAPPPKPPWNPPEPWPEEPNGGGEGDGDPLAQTFRIPPGLPCILSSMDLYFKEKDANEPVQIQLRTTLNGYPTTDILTYSNLNPDNVNVSEDASVATNFPFEDPVTLEANVEYAIVVYSGSPNYNLFYSELGETDLTTGNQVSKNPFSGVYFRAANTSTWQADGFKDMKFKIYRCHFDSPAMLTFANVTGLQTGWTAPAITAVEPKSTRLVYEYSTDGGSTWKTCIANDDIDHSTVATQFQLRVQFITDNSYLSPIVHKDKIGIINVLSLTDGDYFSKEIELDTTAQFLDLYLDQYEPANTDLTVYYTSDEGSQSGNWSSTWKACTLHVSDGRTGIRELENDSYNTKGTTIWKEHEYHNALGAVGRSFRLRINMKTTNRAITPKAKRLRCVFF